MTFPTWRLVLVALTICVSSVRGQQQPSNYDAVVTTHAVLGCVAWVVFFPLGAVVIRLLDSPRAWLVHACITGFAWMMVVTAASLGIWMGVVSQQISGFHPIIGMVVFVLVVFQPLGGLLHHYLYAQRRKNEVVALYHIWAGRIIVTLGMINGGLGLLFSGNASRAECIVYGVIAGVIWVSWITIVVTVPLSRGKQIPGTISRTKQRRESEARESEAESEAKQSMSS